MLRGTTVADRPTDIVVGPALSDHRSPAAAAVARAVAHAVRTDVEEGRTTARLDPAPTTVASAVCRLRGAGRIGTHDSLQ